MFTTTPLPTRPIAPAAQAALQPGGATAPGAPSATPADRPTAQTLLLLEQHLAPRRRVVHAGDTLYSAGEKFLALQVINAGSAKLINVSADGREQVVGLCFRGDWLGFDGIADGFHACDAVAMDTGEVWSVDYEALLHGCQRCPELLTTLHRAMSRRLGRDRESMMSVCTLPADARVAEFLLQWAASLARSGLRFDQITLPLTRAEIGNYLGMTLESVSRALTKLARGGVIGFPERGRRDIRIDDVGALSGFVQDALARTSPLQ